MNDKQFVLELIELLSGLAAVTCQKQIPDYLFDNTIETIGKLEKILLGDNK